MAETRVLVAVKSKALRNLIKCLLQSQSSVKIVTRAGEGVFLAQAARRRLPHLIVASARLSGFELREAIASVKRSYPASKLIMICSVDGFERDARKSGADACLSEETLVRELMPAVLQLSGPRN